MLRTIRDSLVSAHFASWLYSGTLSMKILVTVTVLLRKIVGVDASTVVMGETTAVLPMAA
jgi:hypothetical protein